MSKHLVVIETVKIKEYLFSTNKLKLIRGASYLLDYLNSVITKDILGKNGIKNENENKNIIILAAGNAKFIAKDKEAAEKVQTEILDAYKNMAPGINLAHSILEIKDNETIADLLDEAAAKTAMAKNLGFSKTNFDLPFIKKCCCCGTEPVEINYESDIEKNYNKYKALFDEKHLDNKLEELRAIIKILAEWGNTDKANGICSECFSKIFASTMIKPDKAGIGIYSLINEKFKDTFQYAKTIEEYADDKSFISFIYSDGDSLGEYLRGLKVKNSDDSSYINELHSFSEKLDKATKEALIESIIELQDEFKGDKSKIFCEFIIIGGDDICLVTESTIGLKLTELYQKKFKDKMKEEEITSSAGVVIAKAKTPMFYLFEQSLNLQKKAKEKRHNDEVKDGYIDFQVTGSEGTVNIEEFRVPISTLIERPYNVTSGNFESLIHLITELKKVEFPKNKLRKLYDLKRQYLENHDESISTRIEEQYKTYIERLSDEQKEINWTSGKKIKDLKFDELNNIFDIIEIYDYVDNRPITQEEEKDDNNKI